MRVDIANVQGLVTELYRRTVSRHLLFHLGDVHGGRSFLSRLIPLVTNGAGAAPGTLLLNISVTYQGLQRLRPEWPLDNFETAFIDGPLPRLMGDWPGTPSEEPRWWEGQFTTAQIGCIVHLYADEPSQLDAAADNVRTIAADSGVRELIPRRDGTVLDGRSLGGRRLHFGYVDGISKVTVGWSDDDASAGTTNFRHFVLGYHSESVQSFPKREPLRAVLSDSSYAIVRWLYQDVAGFNRYLAEAATAAYPQLDAAVGQEHVAARLMGRWRDGSPLSVAPEQPNPGMPVDDFTYADDPRGMKCPLTSHIRMVNPRDQPLDALAAIDGVPRILRRGMPYGPPMNGTVDDGVDRGILGIFVCSNIQRQFYTLMRWITRSSFSPVFPDLRAQDAIAGNRGVPDASHKFVVPGPGGDTVFPALPDFVHTKGTAFALVPSLTALRAIAGA
jgi:deferrochelatase/peroxidase EfeB